MTNEARIIKEIGSLLVANKQLCFAHSLQLVVIEVFNQKGNYQQIHQGVCR